MSKQWTELIPPNWPPDILCQVKTRRVVPEREEGRT